MRLSTDTLLLLARAGDMQAERTVLWMYGALPGAEKPWYLLQHLDAEAWTMGGRIGAGYPGARFLA